MEFNRCFGCMMEKQNHPVCEHCGFDEGQQNQPHQLALGTVLRGQYIVGKVLGQGGFGITYLGWDSYLQMPVAIKEYYPGGCVTRNISQTSQITCYTGPNSKTFEANKERFMREGQALARFKNLQHIVQIYSLFPENNTVYLVMEYARGHTLLEHLNKNGFMSMPQLLALLAPIMKDLQKVHEAEIIHRDISPDNIMLLDEGGAKLLDFGAARIVEDPDQESQLSKSTEAILKQGFAPVEQYNARGSLGPWTDVYAMCATICYCLNGRLPQIAPDRAIDDDPDYFIEILPIPDRQKNILRKGMAIRPRDRIASMGELLHQLLASLKPVPETEVLQTVLLQPERQRSARQNQQPPASQPLRTTSGKKFWWIAGAGAAAALVLILLLLPKSGKTPETENIVAATEATAAPTTVPEATAAPVTVPETTAAPVTVPETTAAPVTVPETTAAPVTVPETTAAPITVPEATEAEILFSEDLVLKNFDPEGKSAYAFGTMIGKNDVVSVVFLDSLESAPENAVDVSETGNGKVLLWAEPDSNGLQELFIAGQGRVYLPEDSGFLFGGMAWTYYADYIQLATVDFSGAVDTSRVKDMQFMFCGCTSLTGLDFSGFDTAQVTDMNFMFYDCSSLTSLDVGSFDTSRVTNMSMMFGNCASLTHLDLSGFDTSQVITMESMFNSCSRLTSLELCSFDTAQVRDMGFMFRDCRGLTDLNFSSFDTSQVTDMAHMFSSCEGLTRLDLRDFDTSQVTNMEYMFGNCSSLTDLDLSGFDTSQVTSMEYMFGNCTSLAELKISSFDTSEVTDMEEMFFSCGSLKHLDLSSFDASQAEKMEGMFKACGRLTRDTLITGSQKIKDQFLADQSA